MTTRVAAGARWTVHAQRVRVFLDDREQWLSLAEWLQRPHVLDALAPQEIGPCLTRCFAMPDVQDIDPRVGQADLLPLLQGGVIVAVATLNEGIRLWLPRPVRVTWNADLTRVRQAAQGAAV